MSKKILLSLFVGAFLVNFTQCEEEGIVIESGSRQESDEFGLKKLFAVKSEDSEEDVNDEIEKGNDEEGEKENDEEDFLETENPEKNEEEVETSYKTDDIDEDHEKTDDIDQDDEADDEISFSEFPKKEGKPFFPKKFIVDSDDSSNHRNNNEEDAFDAVDEINTQGSSTQFEEIESSSQPETSADPSAFGSLVDWFVSMFYSNPEPEKPLNESEVNENTLDQE